MKSSSGGHVRDMQQGMHKGHITRVVSDVQEISRESNSIIGDLVKGSWEGLGRKYYDGLTGFWL